MNESHPRIKALGEVSLRVKDLDAMHRFYTEVLGLDVLRREESYVFYKIAEGYGGHTQNLALFDAAERAFLVDKSLQLNSQESTLHHIALNIDLADYQAEKQRLEGLGLKVQAVDHPWVHVRSLYFSDPEGNLLELVCHDESLG
jgi:catechol 2,3-dioxygenase-like lactoylglutathione lyase family enzyme